MNDAVRQLEPRALWDYFAHLNAVPRPSKKEDRVIRFIKDFGESLHLVTEVDGIGNILIRKPATPGMEDKKTVALQSHIDMVHQKNQSTIFDFDTQGIDMYVDGDWVKSKGTTLGADNGIGVASMMAVLAAEDIAHPPIEALFTVDEETGMTGAIGLQGGWLSGEIMLNLDTEEDDELTIGCAGGINVTSKGEYKEVDLEADYAAFKLEVKGLSGGHSGMDIHLNKGNANKLMGRCLYGAAKCFEFNISEIRGGGLRNAIPRESSAVVAVPARDLDGFRAYISREYEVIKDEYKATDPQLELTMEEVGRPKKVFDSAFQTFLLKAVDDIPHGVYRMSSEIAHLVETSNNLSQVNAIQGQYDIRCLTRSSVEREKFELVDRIRRVLDLASLHFEADSDYPGWTPRPKTAIVELMSQLYVKNRKAKPKISACHAGLECGIIGAKYPDMELISFGPNIRHAHSPDEKVQISSVQDYWSLLLDTLKNIPQKD